MFNLGNNDYLKHPPYMSTEVIEDIANFLLDGIHALSAKRVGIVFHGGEPLMLKKRRFIEMCETLTTRIGPHAKLDLSVQTNAMLIDEEWVNDDNPEIKIRLFDNMFTFFAGDKVYQNILPNFSTRNILIVIASNGDISENDDFKMIQFGQNAGNVRNTSMAEFANSPLRQYIGQINQRLPAECLTCDWQNYCLAGVSHGLTVSRFSKARGFDNPSSMCETFKVLFELGATYLLRNGGSIDVLKASLDATPYKERRSTHLPLPPSNLFTQVIPIISQ